MNDPQKNMTTGEILRALRKQQGFSQDYVANIISKGRSAYAYYETGKTAPSYETLTKLARLYRVPVTVFDTGELLINSKQDKYNEEWERGLSFDDLSDIEQELVLKFRVLSRNEKQSLLNILEKNNKK